MISIASPSSSRKELQALAKLNGISANQKSSEILSQLEKLQSSNSPSNSPRTPKSSGLGKVYDDGMKKNSDEDIAGDNNNSTSRRRRRTSSRPKPPSPTSVLQQDGISDIYAESESVSSEDNVNSIYLPEDIKEKVKVAEQEIIEEIKRVDAVVRSEYPALLSPRNQSAVGMCILLGSSVAILYCWKLYYDMCRATGTEGVSGASKLSIAGLMLSIAFFASILHELEHDVIHNLYFPRHKWMQHFMFLVIWIFKFNGNPWWRKKMHLKHHINSGQPSDVEERIIGLGLPAGLFRMSVTMHPYGALLVSRDVSKTADYFNLLDMIVANSPVFIASAILSKLFIFYVVSMYFQCNQSTIALFSDYYWNLLVDFHMLLFIPNIIRQASLVLMSNFSHYYGDIPVKSLFFQNQILDHWALLPFQALCMNFGSTHMIHHYVPGQPFYLRQMISDAGVKDFLIDKGVRRNDFGSLSRANRFFSSNDHKDQQHDGNKGTHRAMLSLKDVTAIDSSAIYGLKMGGFALMCFTVGIITYALYDFVVLFEIPLNTIVQLKKDYNQYCLDQEKLIRDKK